MFDSGDGVSHVVPIYEGKTFLFAIILFTYGKDIQCSGTVLLKAPLSLLFLPTFSIWARGELFP